MTSPHEGYAISESREFTSRAREVLGNLRHWDDVRFGLDLTLSLNPTHPNTGTHLLANLWITEFAGPPRLTVMYEVNESERVVTYVGLSLAL